MRNVKPGKLGQTMLIVFAEFPKVSLKEKKYAETVPTPTLFSPRGMVEMCTYYVRLVGNKDLAYSCGRLRSVQVPGVLANGTYDPLRRLFVSI